MIDYTKDDLLKMKEQKENYYIPQALFDTMQYKMIRLEVKWAYTACLNLLIQDPLYDAKNRPYIKVSDSRLIEILKDLAHKKVDRQKIDGYIQEMEEHELIERNQGDIYLKKVMNVF